MTRLFSRLIVPKFFSVNAGFFLFMFLIMFGVLPGSETIRLHRGIMEAATTTATGIAIAAVVLALYHIKCAAFVVRELSQPQNEFIYLLQGVPTAMQLRVVAAAYVGVFSPLLIYLLLTIGLGINSWHIAGTLSVLLITGVTTLSAITIILNKINGTARHGWAEKLKLPKLNIGGYFTYLLRHSIYQRKGTFVAIKVFSLAALQLMIALNKEQPSRENVCFLIHLCIAAHALLPVYYVQFLEREMAFMRALPIILWKRLALFPATFAIILLPELLFLIYNASWLFGGTLVAALYLLGIIQLSMYSALQYLPGMDTNKYTGVVFGLFFISLILLASVNMWLFIGCETAITAAVFYYCYYRYIPTAGNAADS